MWAPNHLMDDLLLIYCTAGSRFAPSQWETALLCDDVSHWLGTSLDSALYCINHKNMTAKPTMLIPTSCQLQPHASVWKMSTSEYRINSTNWIIRCHKFSLQNILDKNTICSMPSDKYMVDDNDILWCANKRIRHFGHNVLAAQY